MRKKIFVTFITTIGIFLLVRLILGVTKRSVAQLTTAYVNEMDCVADRVLLPVVASGDQTWESKDNDDYLHADGPLRSGIIYQGYLDDNKDYFSFDLGIPGRIEIYLTSPGDSTGKHLETQGVQLILVYYDAQAKQLKRIKRVYTPPYTITKSNLPLRRYYVYVYVPTPDDTLYNLRVVFPAPTPTPTSSPLPTSPPVPMCTPTATLSATPTSTSTNIPTYTPTNTPTTQSTPTDIPTATLTPVCPVNTPDGSHLAVFDTSRKILSNATTEADARTDPVDVQIPSGEYRVSLSSYDNAHPGGETQTDERWYLELYSEKGGQGTLIATSEPISDLDDDDVCFATPEPVNDGLYLSQEVLSVVGVHAAYYTPEPNSIAPALALLEPATSNYSIIMTQTPTATPTLPPRPTVTPTPMAP